MSVTKLPKTFCVIEPKESYVVQKFLLALVVALLLVWRGGPADAQTHPSTSENDHHSRLQVATKPPANPNIWRFEITPYLWASDFDGDISVGDRTAEASADFGDLLDNLNFAFSLRTEAWKKNWGVVFDGWYVNLGDERGTDIRNRSLGVEITTRQAIVDLAAAYRTTISPSVDFDVIGGIRYRYMDLELDFLNIQDRKASEQWVEPVIGGRFVWRLNRDWTAALRGDVSGGSIDADSAFTWSLTAGVDYLLTNTVSLKAGYRVLHTDVRSEGLGLEATLQGFGLGVSFHL